MRYLRQILPIMIATISLSGCSSKNIKVRPTSCSNANTELVKPLSMPPSLLKIESADSIALRETIHFAKNQYPLEPDQSLEVAISEYGYTRVSIEDERITDVFVFPQERMQVRIHQQGYLIIAPNPVETNPEEEELMNYNNTQLTITGEHGTTQDFSLRLTGKAPEPVKFVKSNLEQINLKNGD
jgi:hypothetical protein